MERHPSSWPMEILRKSLNNLHLPPRLCLFLLDVISEYYTTRRPDHIPHADERSALQRMSAGQRLPLHKLHPAGKKTVARMLATGWIESEAGVYGVRYLITPVGRAALMAKITPTHAKVADDDWLVRYGGES